MASARAASKRPAQSSAEEEEPREDCQSDKATGHSDHATDDSEEEQEKPRAQAALEDPQLESEVVLKAHITSLRLLFSAWLSHFSSLGYIRDSTMDMLDKKVLRSILQLSVKDPNARLAIGSSEPVWEDITSLLALAVPSLESRSYATIPDPYDTANPPTATVYDGPSSNVIVLHHQSLLKDLQRMNNMLCIARNILTAGPPAQVLAAQLCVDREVCCLVNLCVKITARGYDGDGTGTDEEKWQAVVNEFKKLLITCLQFLSNLVTLNEQLKLMLWVELFESSSEGNVSGWPDPAVTVRPPVDITYQQAEQLWANAASAVLSLGSQQFMRQAKSDDAERFEQHSPSLEPVPPQIASQDPVRSLPAGVDPYLDPKQPHRMWMEDNLAALTKHIQVTGIEDPTPEEILAHAKTLFDSSPDSQTAPYKERYARELGEVADLLAQYLDPKGSKFQEIVGDGDDAGAFGAQAIDDPAFAANGYLYPPSPEMETAEQGIQKLEAGKKDLLERLDNNNHIRTNDRPEASPASPVDQCPAPALEISGAAASSEVQSRNGASAEGEDEEEGGDEDGEDEDPDLASEELDEEEEDGEEAEDEADASSEDEYDRVPGEDGRGLLTDVPLILGPNEIEVLPMIIMSGIVTDAEQVRAKQEEGPEQLQIFLNMYTIRCHLLLAQENGRNLLRELLIFVAAWDLREEELYFKFMVKIMESILMHGLMWFAYSAFKEKKDIISPAQAVIMKLLTKIFHSRQAFIRTPENEGLLPHPQNGITKDPTVAVVRSLFKEFRSHIIPGICALICLQGQIRRGRASMEEFPLNLWDMERMYEGVYQYLEFFAILTDHEEWKTLMAEWEVVSELVTLLRELEDGIGKRTLVRSSQTPSQPQGEHHPAPPLLTNPRQRPANNTDSKQTLPSQEAQTNLPLESTAEQQFQNPPPPVSIERPYSPLPTAPTEPPTNLTPSAAPNTFAPPPPMPPDRSNSINSGAASHSPPLHEEPADFEWRNLKKLCVLVLSSLVWKNPTLQDQVLRFGGIETILRCCQHDEHNPYIREHAIMCLRFCIEGNERVRDAVRDIRDRTARDAGPEAGAQEHEGIPVTIERTDGVDVDVAGPSTAEGDETPTQTLSYPPELLTVPPEVLDAHGYETFMDARGQVGLRRKPGSWTESPSAHDYDGESEEEDDEFAWDERVPSAGQIPRDADFEDIPPSLRPGRGVADTGV